MKKIPALIFMTLFLAVTVSSLATAESHYIEGGQAFRNGHRMMVKDSIVLWNPGGRELIIGFFSYELTEEEVREIVEKGDFQTVAVKHPALDGEPGPYRPYVSVRMPYHGYTADKKLSGPNPILDYDDLKGYHIDFHFFEPGDAPRDSYRHNHKFDKVYSEEKNMGLRGKLAEGNLLSGFVKEKGPANASSLPTPERYHWNIIFRSKVYSVKSREERQEKILKDAESFRRGLKALFAPKQK